MDAPWQQAYHQLPFRLERQGGCLLICQPAAQRKVTAAVCVALGAALAGTAWLLPEAGDRSEHARLSPLLDCAGSFGEFGLLDHVPARDLAEALRSEVLSAAGLTRIALSNP